MDLLARDDGRRRAQVLDPRVRARADEDAVDGDVLHRGAGLEAHVGERALGGGRRSASAKPAGSGTRPVTGTTISGFVPQVTCGASSATSIVELAVVRGVGIGRERAPVVERLLPRGAGRRCGPAFEIGERRVVGRDHPRPGTGLDRHVADRHPVLHREAANRLARVLEHMTDPAGDAEPADRAEDHVLRRHVGRQLALEADAHRARPRLRQALRREHVLDLGRADAERERAERAVGRGVAVAADDRHPRLRQPELRADHVDDPFAAAAGREERNAELLAVAAQGVELRLGERIA